MQNARLVHVLLSEAGEPEAGPTEFASHVTGDEASAAACFRTMEAACLAFIHRQIEIIELNEEMREYNELAYGWAGAGYFYRVFWFCFSNTLPIESDANDWIRFHLCDLDAESAVPYLHRYAGSGSDEDGLSALMDRLC